MVANPVAMVWWPAPHEAYSEHPIYADQVARFGRASNADIAIGQLPVYDEDVPRCWGEFSWHRGKLMIANVDDRWSFDVVSLEAGEPISRQSVAPQSSLSPASLQFRIEAQVPGAVSYVLNVQCARRAPFQNPGDTMDPPTFIAFALTAIQKLIGRAIVAPLHAGRSRRASYEEVAQATFYGRSYVREIVAGMDALFVTHQLAELVQGTDTLDRVAATLIKHPALLR